MSDTDTTRTRNRTTTVVLIEDDEDDYILTQDLIHDIEDDHFELKWVSTYEAAVEAIRSANADVYLVDYRLGQYNGLDLLHEASQQGLHAPLILLTGKGNRDIDMEAMLAGASDYLVKGEMNSYLLERAIRYAIERKTSEEQVRRHADRAEALALTASRLNDDLNLDTVLEAVCEETARALGVPMVCISFDDPTHEKFRLAHAKGLPPDLEDHFREFADERVRATWKAQKSTFVIKHDDAQWNSEVRDAFDRNGIKSIAYAPLLRNRQLIGNLSVFSPEKSDFFNLDERSLLEGLATLASQAITNARLLQDTQRRLEQVQTLVSIDVAISGNYDLKVTLSIILEHIRKQLHADAVAFLALNPVTERLTYHSGMGFLTDNIAATNLGPGEGMAGKIVQEQKVRYETDVRRADSKFTRFKLLRDEDFVSYVGAPLVAKGRVQGVLEIFHRTAIEPNSEWMEFLKALAGQTSIAIENGMMFSDLKVAYDATIEGWSRAMDLKDEETEGHSLRVTEMTLRAVRAMSVSEAEIIHIRRGALLHDIGKIGVPDSILLKPGPLNDEEWVVMKKHPQYAYEMLSPIEFLQPALEIPYCHHEKWDGSGYPRGLKGTEIPLSARIFAIVDVWDALCSNRPYRAAWPVEKVIDHIRNLSGTHFDPDVVDLFLKSQVLMQR